MAHILLVDTNPDHVRSLTGLIKYRTSSDFTVAQDCVEALRVAYGEHPDLIMINVMMFCSSDYGFSRALKETRDTARIPVIVHLSGRLEALTQKRIRACGVANILELPISADELEYEADAAIAKGQPAASDDVQSVSWTKLSLEQAKPLRSRKRPPARRPSEVRAVNWAMDGHGTRAPLEDPPDPRGRITGDGGHALPQDEPPGVFQSLSGSLPRMQSEARDPSEQGASFKPNQPDALPVVDPKDVKN